MNDAANGSRSPWMSDLAATPKALSRDLQCDVVIVGAGIAGMTTAYLLARSGKDVVVLDAGVPGGGMTARTTGHLVTALDGRWFNLIARRGIKTARMAAVSHPAAIDFIESVQRAENIACDFARVEGFLTLGPDDDVKLLEREEKAAAKLGLAVDRAPSPYPGIPRVPSLRFPGQGRFHAVKYVNGLVDAFQRAGGKLFCARVTDVKGGKKAVVKAGARKVTAMAAIIATNSPITGEIVHGKQTPYRTYVIAGPVPKGSVPDALIWDTEEPYHYIRIQPERGHDLLIVGGEDHKTGADNDMAVRLQRLEAWARARFPTLSDVTYRWSGQVMETLDDLALIGRNPGVPENVFIVTGDSGIGLTHGTIAGMALAGKILGTPAAWAPAYDPKRAKPPKLDPHMRKDKAAERKSKAAAPTEASVSAGEGAVIGKIAVYRDPGGKLIRRSAKCTHMGCPVSWNGFERCWDCGCHGSHFAADGAVIHAPAVKDLDPIKAKAR